MSIASLVHREHEAIQAIKRYDEKRCRQNGNLQIFFEEKPWHYSVFISGRVMFIWRFRGLHRFCSVRGLGLDDASPTRMVTYRIKRSYPHQAGDIESA